MFNFKYNSWGEYKNSRGKGNRYNRRASQDSGSVASAAAHSSLRAAGREEKKAVRKGRARKRVNQGGHRKVVEMLFPSGRASESTVGGRDWLRLFSACRNCRGIYRAAFLTDWTSSSDSSRSYRVGRNGPARRETARLWLLVHDRLY